MSVEVLVTSLFEFPTTLSQEYFCCWGHLCVKNVLTINDLYNGAKIVNLPLVVVDI